ncbi:cation transporter [Ruminococcaceae bacterium OttesenSCG-928-A16]|nr:cation transporter [Ruminococcaceae bacterium OttesenSCG-928-A16]
MKKQFKLEELGCASCAAKMETAVAKLPGVTNVQVNFMRETLTLEAADEQFDDVVKAAQKAIKKIEPDVRVIL